jgi:RNA recognition motif-containing protein
MSESGDTDDIAPAQSHDGSPYPSSPTMQHEPQAQQQLGQYGSQTESMGSTTLAVTNLPYRIRWQDLKDLFRRYGTPSRADVFLAPDGRSRGVGMVSMRTRREAEGCVNDLNGYEWFGRKIGVKIDETGGHHALAAAAMAGATIWESMSFAQDQEVCTHISCSSPLSLLGYYHMHCS